MNLKIPTFFCLFCMPLAGASLTQLGKTPDWNELERFQESITRNEFYLALTEVYCPRKEWWAHWIEVEEDHVRIREEAGKDLWYTLRFASPRDGNQTQKGATHSRPLAGLVIAVDPGHIGGAWSEMEGRHFQIGEEKPVKEGDLALAVARALIPELERLGSLPYLVRETLEPVTARRPSDFMDHSRKWVKQIAGELPTAEELRLIKERSELLFYRVDEIHARAQLINDLFRPDLVLCIHINAAPWQDPDHPALVDRNDFHILVNGCYMGGELAYDDQRFEMLVRLLNRWHIQERLLAESLSLAFAAVTGLPEFSYKGPNALKVGDVPGVWARNLLANRIYRSPVIFLEPYVANSRSAHELIQKGENGEFLAREYVDSVVLGLKKFYSKTE
jgi:hypothetical protein